MADFDFDAVDLDYVDPDAADNGVWFEYELPNGKVHGFRCKPMGASNKPYREAFERVIKSFPEILDKRGRKPSQDRLEQFGKAYRKVVAEHVVMDWRGVTDRKGKPVPFSVDAFMAYADKMPLVVAGIEQDAQRFENFRHQVEAASAEAAEGN